MHIQTWMQNVNKQTKALTSNPPPPVHGSNIARTPHAVQCRGVCARTVAMWQNFFHLLHHHTGVCLNPEPRVSVSGSVHTLFLCVCVCGRYHFSCGCLCVWTVCVHTGVYVWGLYVRACAWTSARATPARSLPLSFYWLPHHGLGYR